MTAAEWGYTKTHPKFPQRGKRRPRKCGHGSTRLLFLAPGLRFPQVFSIVFVVHPGWPEDEPKSDKIQPLNPGGVEVETLDVFRCCGRLSRVDVLGRSRWAGSCISMSSLELSGPSDRQVN